MVHHVYLLTLQGIYVTDCKNCNVQVFDQQGQFLYKWGSPGSEEGQFRAPTGIVFIAAVGQIVVADQCNDRLQLFSKYGTFSSKWASKSWRLPVQPEGLAIAPSNDQIAVSDKEGVHLFKFQRQDKHHKV